MSDNVEDLPCSQNNVTVGENLSYSSKERQSNGIKELGHNFSTLWTFHISTFKSSTKNKQWLEVNIELVNESSMTGWMEVLVYAGVYVVMELFVQDWSSWAKTYFSSVSGVQDWRRSWRIPVQVPQSSEQRRVVLNEMNLLHFVRAGMCARKQVQTFPVSWIKLNRTRGHIRCKCRCIQYQR